MDLDLLFGKMKHYLILITPILIVGIILYVLSQTANKGFSSTLISVLKQKLKLILYVSLILAILIGLVMTQLTRLGMMQQQKQKAELRQKSKIYKMRLGVQRE